MANNKPVNSTKAPFPTGLSGKILMVEGQQLKKGESVKKNAVPSKGVVK
jgi:hypothetical protein